MGHARTKGEAQYSVGPCTSDLLDHAPRLQCLDHRSSTADNVVWYHRQLLQELREDRVRHAYIRDPADTDRRDDGQLMYGRLRRQKREGVLRDAGEECLFQEY